MRTRPMLESRASQPRELYSESVRFRTQKDIAKAPFVHKLSLVPKGWQLDSSTCRSIGSFDLGSTGYQLQISRQWSSDNANLEWGMSVAREVDWALSLRPTETLKLGERAQIDIAIDDYFPNLDLLFVELQMLSNQLQSFTEENKVETNHGTAPLFPDRRPATKRIQF
jgi:hypothetical protein